MNLVNVTMGDGEEENEIENPFSSTTFRVID
jgi:hypothetical protein